MLSETNLILAALAALGVWLFWSGLTSPILIFLSRRRGVRLTFNPEDPEQQIRLTPTLDRALGPFIAGLALSLAALLRREDKDRDLIAAAGYPARYPNVNTFYAWKAILAVGFMLQGLLVAFFLSPEWIFAAFILGLVGLFLPDLHLRSLANKRRELIRTEMAFVLHRLAILTSAGLALPQAIEQIAIKPGGPFVQELRKLSQDISSGVLMSDALDALAQRTAGIEDVARLIGLLKRSMELGSPISEALTGMATILQDRIQQDIETRGMVASTQMILPIGCLILPAIGIATIGPVIYIAIQTFLQ